MSLELIRMHGQSTGRLQPTTVLHVLRLKDSLEHDHVHLSELCHDNTGCASVCWYVQWTQLQTLWVLHQTPSHGQPSVVLSNSMAISTVPSEPDCTCRCKFFKTHELPCKHIFVKDLSSNKSWITQPNWDRWAVTTACRAPGEPLILDRVEANQ
ncbi:hypothetical protein EDD86DRAFT_73370 [Gorgonomyces haynaldii]|nr:hypothetical protein EDD86DRAFT_73370 [Gorgonomyces haynaldii]